jgi:multisubunit Na+/H+ antiporter MnhE subunit
MRTRLLTAVLAVVWGVLAVSFVLVGNQIGAIIATVVSLAALSLVWRYTNYGEPTNS